MLGFAVPDYFIPFDVLCTTNFGLSKFYYDLRSRSKEMSLATVPNRIFETVSQS